MSTHIFRNITRVLGNFPLDTTKKGRDIGEFIRKKIAANFSQGESTKVTDIEYWSKFSLHLENISQNKALKKYPRIYNSTATGFFIHYKLAKFTLIIHVIVTLFQA